MDVREAFQPYTDSLGFISDSRGGTSQNALLYTSEYYILLAKLGILTDEDRAEFVRLVRLCQIEPGLLKRRPGSADGEAWDDYKGVLAAAAALDLRFLAEEILDYAEAHSWCFNNLRPGHFSFQFWFGRDPAFVAHTYLSAGKIPDLGCVLTFAYDLEMGGRSNRNDQDARTMCWLMLQTGTWRGNEICEAAAKSWWARFRQDYPGGMKEVQRNYLSDKSHPFGIYWVD